MKSLIFDFFWIWSIIDIHIIYSIRAKIPYLGKICFRRYWPKCSWPIRLQDFWINYIPSLKWLKMMANLSIIKMIKKSLSLACWYKSKEIKIPGWSWSKNVCDHSSHWALKLAFFQERINRINSFFAWWHKFRKARNYCLNFWVSMDKNGLDPSGHGSWFFCILIVM